jgi:HTH-type transcriptional regulator / antitoxin MqsA
MRCEVCGVGTRRDWLIRYPLLIDDHLLVVENVPAAVCDRCGETTLTPATVERLQEQVWGAAAPVRVLETPVYEFA